MSSVYNRQTARERPDTDGAFILPWRAICHDDPAHRSPIECQFQEVFYTEDAAKHALATHQHPLIYDPPRRYGYLSIAEKYWLELDKVVDGILGWEGSQEDRDFIKLQGRASGLAFAIVGACTPYYPDETAVSKQSLTRWKQRKGHVDWEPTPGFKYDPPIPGVRDSSTRIDASAPTYKNTELQKAIGKLGTAKVGQIKQAMNSTPAMFTAAQLAPVYGVTPEIIEAIAKS